MMRVLSLLGIFLLSFLTLVPSVLGQATPNVSEIPKSLEAIENYEVADEGLVKAERRLYLYLPADEFQLNSVKTIVDRFRQDYPKPEWLEITIYSDREALVKKAKGDRLPLYVDFPNTKEGILAAVKFREKIYGKEFGFMRAVYTRYNGNESLDYSKTPADKILTRERPVDRAGPRMLEGQNGGEAGFNGHPSATSGAKSTFVPVKVKCKDAKDALGQASNVWRGITPLVSTRSDVERMIGKPESLGRSKYLLLYKTSDGKVFVYYSQGPCAIGAKAGWNVPEYTVVRISFDPTVFPRVDDLKIDRTRFQLHPDPEILNSAFYTNETDGIVLTVDTSDNTVTNFSYFPESKYDYLQCKNIGSESKGTKNLEQ